MEQSSLHVKKQNSVLYGASKRVGRAIAEYDMLHDGDKIIVAVSGGKDSVTLLKLLQYRRRFIPITIDLLAVYVDMGMPGVDINELIAFFTAQEVPYHIEKVDILEGKTWADMDCFRCSWVRRKTLFNLAERFGCNKIAFGHHMDDIAETILLNMFYHGNIGVMRPKQELFKGKLTLIRPLAYLPEHEVARVAQSETTINSNRFRCPVADNSKRARMKELIAQLKEEDPAVMFNIVRSVENIKKDYLF
jgi:tRNA 2-thiocytidine biosynthesis protein TtcA